MCNGHKPLKLNVKQFRWVFNFSLNALSLLNKSCPNQNYLQNYTIYDLYYLKDEIDILNR